MHFGKMNEMKLFPDLERRYSAESRSALEAQRLAHEISFGPVVFQVSRLMVKFGILQALLDSNQGLTRQEVAERCGISCYAAQVLLESSLAIGTVLFKEGRFEVSKAGWFLLNDSAVKVNMNFNHDVNYLGWFNLEEALLEGEPAGLRVFGEWETLYEGLSRLPERARESWFAFDHFYSDSAFDEALEIVFERHPRALLDVGGNTGRWALRCVARDPEVRVTIMDLPLQVELMKEQTAGLPGADRISGLGTNLLDRTTPFPTGFDAIWMSQFLDCFSEEEATSILTRAARAMSDDARLFIMETFWDRQRFETAAYCLTQISLYFTAMANGNSKMYLSGDLVRCVEEAGLTVERTIDGLGQGHSILVCKKENMECNKVNVLDLLPQKPPFVMIDRLLHCDMTMTCTSLLVTDDNIFCDESRLTGPGIVENIAQTCAVRIGYISKYVRHEPIKLGFIGAIRDMDIFRLPCVGEVLTTRVEVREEIFQMTLVSASVKVGEELIASCEMKISTSDIECK
jgi:predicted hotdog family 3-hydroxylacyl-ACP dehydratase